MFSIDFCKRFLILLKKKQLLQVKVAFCFILLDLFCFSFREAVLLLDRTFFRPYQGLLLLFEHRVPHHWFPY